MQLISGNLRWALCQHQVAFFRTIYDKSQSQYLCRVVVKCSPSMFAVVYDSKRFTFPEDDDLSFYDSIFKVSKMAGLLKATSMHLHSNFPLCSKPFHPEMIYLPLRWRDSSKRNMLFVAVHLGIKMTDTLSFTAKVDRYPKNWPSKMRSGIVHHKFDRKSCVLPTADRNTFFSMVLNTRENWCERVCCWP